MWSAGGRWDNWGGAVCQKRAMWAQQVVSRGRWEEPGGAAWHKKGKWAQLVVSWGQVGAAVD